MKSKFIFCLLTALCIGLVSYLAAAQSSGDFTVLPSVVSSGGGSASAAGGVFGLISVIGEPAAGERLAGSSFVFRSGFFSPQFAPSSAAVPVSGRVLTAEGTGIKDAILLLAGGTLTAPRIARANNFGNFMFEGVEVGHFYTVTVSHKKYVFSNNTQSFVLFESISNLVFRAD